MRSASASGPEGCAQPSITARSASATPTTPASTIRTAPRMYGSSSALTTKPGRSAVRRTCLPSTPSAKPAARSATAGSVSDVATSSTSGSVATGSKKWSPSTRPGARVRAARCVSGMEVALEASTAQGSVTTSSRRAKTSHLTDSSSRTASATSCRSAKSPRSVVKRRCRPACSRSRRVRTPAETPRSSDSSTRERPVSVLRRVDSQTRTSTPARAQTSAMPEPMRPVPTTPTRSIGVVAASVVLISSSSLPSRVVSRICRGAVTAGRGHGPSSCCRCGRAGRPQRWISGTDPPRSSP